MSNVIEFREVQRRTTNGGGIHTVETWWEYRTKDVIIGVLGVSLGVWSDWERVDTIRVDQNGNPL